MMNDGAIPPEIAADPGAAAALDRFLRIVTATPALQAQLGEIDRPDRYNEAVVALAGLDGIVLSPDAVTRAMRPDPITVDHWPGQHWLPARSVRTADAPAFDWAWFGPHALTDPFYDDSVRHAVSRPFNRMFRPRTTLEALVAGVAADDIVPPDGFIFHMSRCGSTLAAQMLAAVPHHIVLSEPEPLDAVVHWATTSGAPLPDQIAALRAIVAALGRERSGAARRFFVKLDSWHTLALPLFRAAFPAVPWLFLYRDPAEVMVSQMRMRGMQTVAGGWPARLFAIPDGASLPGEHYCARVLARTCAAVLDHWQLGGGMLIDYADLADAMAGRIPAHFGFRPDDREAAAMIGALATNAKQPGRAFIPDGEEKRATASDAIAAATSLHIKPLYKKLELLRRRES